MTTRRRLDDLEAAVELQQRRQDEEESKPPVKPFDYEKFGRFYEATFVHHARPHPNVTRERIRERVAIEFNGFNTYLQQHTPDELEQIIERRTDEIAAMSEEELLECTKPVRQRLIMPRD